MRRGQIGTTDLHRAIFIWEGAVAVLPGGPVQTLEWVARRTGRYGQAIGYWKIQSHAVALMWSLLARTHLRIDLCVTTRSERFTQAVAGFVEDHNWPVHYVFCEDPQALGRRLPTMPDVERVYYGLESQRWAYGPTGYHLDRSRPITVS